MTPQRPPREEIQRVMEWLWADHQRRVRDGTRCRVCGRWDKVYRRRLNTGMARSLLAMYRHDPAGWMDVRAVAGDEYREEGKLVYWDLVRERVVETEWGGARIWMRLTSKGRDFVEGHTTVPSHALVYHDRCYALDGPHVTIRDCLAAKFDYTELMNA
jgi:ribosomal protein S14